ncbi:hypothetical protein CERZMDRAFT_84745 [Cercospora zeae-maydis SCOH1-5]|uniref:N-acetyltransferase domain-containing protein n=1 Tax=Cercospora zeae-maydis SCOH1-5 TaxID=717836 RepID=A0A6A6FG46_9PEZI|nr:hypothetical protein CERZMDRAFT_84745 [Cercospora zeae-maydis SCOH1-5]
MSPLIVDQFRSTPASAYRRRPWSKSFAMTSARPDDVPSIVNIEFDAFKGETTNHILSYRDYTQPAHRQRALRLYRTAMNGMCNRRRSPSARRVERETTTDDVRFRKVTDLDNKLIISFTKYEFKTYTQDELASPADIGHEEESLMNRKWFALNEQLKRDYMGTQRHCYVNMLATLTAHQHRGAARMLLEAVLREADDAGIECYLEATDAAKPLYERRGFQTVNVLEFDPAQYGVDGFRTERQTIMVRGAWDSTTKQRKPVRSWHEATGREGSPSPTSSSNENSENEDGA